MASRRRRSTRRPKIPERRDFTDSLFDPLDERPEVVARRKAYLAKLTAEARARWRGRQQYAALVASGTVVERDSLGRPVRLTTRWGVKPDPEPVPLPSDQPRDCNCVPFHIRAAKLAAAVRDGHRRATLEQLPTGGWRRIYDDERP